MARLACTIVLEGQLGDRFNDAFEMFTMTTVDGRSRLTGSVTDQAELQGVLRRLFDLGLTVVSFTTDAVESPG